MIKDLLPIIIVLPGLLALGAIFYKKILNSWIVGAVSLVNLVLSLGLLCLPDLGKFSTWFYIDWFDLLHIRFAIGLDFFSLSLILLTNLVYFVSIVFFKSQSRTTLINLLFLQSALILVFSASDIFLFYIAWELVMIPVLIILYMESSSKDALYLFVYTLLGSLFMLVGFVILYLNLFAANQGALVSSYEAIKNSIQNLGPDQKLNPDIYWILFGLAFAIKAPLFILHGWQPKSYSVAPSHLTVIMAALLSKMAVYGIIRYLVQLFGNPSETLQLVVLIVSILGVIYGALLAWRSDSMKKLLAYASLSHLNLMIFGIVSFQTLSITGAAFLSLQHGLIITALFLLAELLPSEINKGQLGLFNSNQLIAGFLLFFSLANIGFPGLSGFVGELTIILGAMPYFKTITIFVALVVVISALYQMRVLRYFLFGESRGNLIEVNLMQKGVLFLLAILVLFFGLYPNILFNKLIF